MLLHSSTVSAPNESKKSQSKSCLKLVMFFWILRGTTNFAWWGSLERLHWLKQIFQHAWQEFKVSNEPWNQASFKGFLRMLSLILAPHHNFATNLTMHKTHGNLGQAAEESCDNQIRVPSRPRGPEVIHPTCRPELQGPVRRQGKGCPEQHWSPVTNRG